MRKALQLPKLVKTFNFEGVCLWLRGRVQSKKLFSETISHKICLINFNCHVKSWSTKVDLIAIFEKFLAGIEKVWILAGRLSTQLSFYKFLRFSQRFQVLSCSNVARQVVYTMFITCKRTSFHFWWKENMVENRKVSICYEMTVTRSLVCLLWLCYWL